MDPDIPMADSEFIAEMKKLGSGTAMARMALRGFRPGSITGSIWRAGTKLPFWQTSPRGCAGISARRKRQAWK